jgi:3-deoxy-manno-octulosonate cytidylyltransferase (CMP-KDO synthetase)
MASTRFPGKPLARIGGVPMICWTARRASQAKSLREVFIAAEDQSIVEEARKYGLKARLVQGDFKAGSDRVTAAVRDLNAPVVVNIQADEPLIEPEIIDATLELLESRPEFGLTTAVRPIRFPEEYRDPHCVKVILDTQDRCLYFSRASIPAQRKSTSEFPTDVPLWRHVGLYCFRREVLDQFSSLPSSPLEISEGLEQLRYLEAGGTIGAVRLIEAVPGVDTPEDLLALEKHISNHNISYT